MYFLMLLTWEFLIHLRCAGPITDFADTVTLAEWLLEAIKWKPNFSKLSQFYDNKNILYKLNSYLFIMKHKTHESNRSHFNSHFHPFRYIVQFMSSYKKTIANFFFFLPDTALHENLRKFHADPILLHCTAMLALKIGQMLSQFQTFQINSNKLFHKIKLKLLFLSSCKSDKV